MTEREDKYDPWMSDRENNRFGALEAALAVLQGECAELRRIVAEQAAEIKRLADAAESTARVICHDPVQ